MRKRLTAAVFVFSASAAFAQSSADLVRLSARDMRLDGIKQSDMMFVEIRRAPDASLVEVSSAPGSSGVPSSMFILKGMCSIAESRGKQYFRVVQVSKKPMRFGVTFPEDAGPGDVSQPAGVTDKIFSLAQCSLLNF